MRRKLIAGNWKMNTNRASAEALARGIVQRASEFSGLDLLVCPPAVYLIPINDIVAGTSVALGAQNVYYEPEGAFTGEISTAMLVDVGCRYVIVGHS